MNFSPKRENELELNLTPLIDVVFLLLIFFMVSTTFERESEISIELPESAGEEAVNDRFVIEISIDVQGRYFINQRKLKDKKIESLKKGIREVRATQPDDSIEPKLIISADQNTPHQAVVRAMDAARQLGLVHLTFATKLANE
ncbi:Biopolymer transport protein ExbD/TolR [hydrothermal vent metagenome]|uniref:Biopolymer transport protein ExbD/TolR n=1 Tax=hydrothermal vent metagenome TaxID=652676 RepID=A0A3B1ANJ1_9ZZZZ